MAKELRCGDVLHENLPTGAFDVVYVQAAIHHLQWDHLSLRPITGRSLLTAQIRSGSGPDAFGADGGEAQRGRTPDPPPTLMGGGELRAGELARVCRLCHESFPFQSSVK